MKNANLSQRVTPQMDQALAKKAKKLGISKAEAVRSAIENYIKGN